MPANQQRLDSWKEIATFFGRDQRTVKRWEKTRLLPVHRIPGGQRSGVFAYPHELTRWLNSSIYEGTEEPARSNQARIRHPFLQGLWAAELVSHRPRSRRHV